MTKSPSLLKSIRLGFMVLVGLVVYAYGFQVTRVRLDEFRNESRQESRVRVTRALARPEIFEYEQEEFVVSAPIMVPCPAGELNLPKPDTRGPYMILTPPCNNPGRDIQVEGFNFEPNTEGPISFVPSSDPNHKLALQRGRAEADGEGHFSVIIELPERPSEELQYIRTTTRRNVGAPRLTKTAYDTWDKIIETVFLALLATTIGTALSVPISFLAARNLMKDVKSPLSSIALSILGWPAGSAIGYLSAQWVGKVSAIFSPNLALNFSGAIFSPLLALVVIRWALPQEESAAPSPGMRLTRKLALFIAALFSVFAVYMFTSLGITVGSALSESLGVFAFLGNFISTLGDILRTMTPAAVALAGGGVLGSAAGRLGQALTERLPIGTLKSINFILAATAGAVLFSLVGGVIAWLYEIKDPLLTLWGPAAAGGTLGIFLALKAKVKDALPIGITIYYITRTILNATRSVEALVMAIVAVIWVGIGPFAGTLALALHTVAALAKLYSEQVESILPGPLEAVRATGANRLQTIVYAVFPQIIPPYISFTMYRWDINVRMSTIIGFAGGGGIGFLLQQNINLLNYRAASAQMLAIAIVVATMDYVSSLLREKFV